MRAFAALLFLGSVAGMVQEPLKTENPGVPLSDQNKKLKEENKVLKASVSKLKAEYKKCQDEIALIKSEKAGAADAEETKRSCGDLETCSSCTGQSHCVFCRQMNKCVEGNIEGPTVKLTGNDTACQAVFEYAFCAGEPCGSYPNCKRCNMDPFCGWCESAGTCAEGTSLGPIVGRCKRWEHGKCGSSAAVAGEDGADETSGQLIQTEPSAAHANTNLAFQQTSLAGVMPKGAKTPSAPYREVAAVAEDESQF